MKKLVKKSSDGRLLEVDTKALHREALELKAKIEIASDEEQRKLDYRRKMLPLIDAALNGYLVFPYMHSPYNLREMMEGMAPELPGRVEELYFRFLNRIQGSPNLSSYSVVVHGHYVPGASEEIIGGERYEWVIFED